MKKLFVIAGCNGAGKTTASYTILPEILDCKEFVNADEIAKGLSPFQPEKLGIEAGKLMLTRIKNLLESGENFAFETTLSTKSYVSFLKEVKQKGYQITLLFFWLNSPDLAVSRVKTRVKEGGHNIPEDVIRRRYESGLLNFFKLYIPITDNWMLINNSGKPYQIIAEGTMNDLEITNVELWNELKTKYHGQ
ncbi:MAG TPA: zeta toxin family protein [Cytophagaceae bacterium]|jgi:predicted ABC-type ATPase|nr:zeta toxin family protein [Cytophagaceae bacterium]